MKLKAWLREAGSVRAIAVALGVMLAQGSLFADGVCRTVVPAQGGCTVTLAWNFSGKVGSDLVLEERFGGGWKVDSSTVPLGSLDACWLSGGTMRFAVKPRLLAKPGSISFFVRAAGKGADASVNGDWMMYLGGVRRHGLIAGGALLSLSTGDDDDDKPGAGESGDDDGLYIAISAFKVVDGVINALSYTGVESAGTLVIEGCYELSEGWSEIKRVKVSAGDGKLTLKSWEVGGCQFMRLKFYKEEN